MAEFRKKIKRFEGNNGGFQKALAVFAALYLYCLPGDMPQLEGDIWKTETIGLAGIFMRGAEVCDAVARNAFNR